jgi:sugar phosphate isomerase/epimerase
MINRRRFIASSAAGLASLSRVQPARAKFTLGIGTYTYRGVSIDKMIEGLQALDIRQIELSLPQFMLPRVRSEEVAEVKAKLDRAGIDPVSYYCGTIKTEEDLNRTIQTAKTLRARNVSGDAVGDALKMIDERFSREHLTFGIHNHWFRGRRFQYESPEDVLKALRGLSQTVGATLDTGHTASCGYDPVDALNKLEKYLKLVHLKDVERSGDDKNVVLGTGVARISDVIDTLKQLRFSGLVAIEYEANKDDPQLDVARCVTFARRHM